MRFSLSLVALSVAPESREIVHQSCTWISAHSTLSLADFIRATRHTTLVCAEAFEGVADLRERERERELVSAGDEATNKIYRGQRG